MGCVIKYKGQSIPEEQFLQYLNKQITINNLFNENKTLANAVYEALGLTGNIIQDNKSYYRGQIEQPTIDKNGNLVLYAKEDELYKRAGLKSKGVSMTDNLKSAIDYGNGQLEVARNLASESYDAEQELDRLLENGYYLIQIPKNISNEVVKEAEEVKVIGDKIIIPKGQYKIEQVVEGLEAQITPQQKQQAQQLYSQHLDTIFPDSQVKDIVYHGGNANIDKFDKSVLSSSTGAASALLGFFFSNNIEVANSYGKKVILEEIGELKILVDAWENTIKEAEFNYETKRKIASDLYKKSESLLEKIKELIKRLLGYDFIKNNELYKNALEEANKAYKNWENARITHKPRPVKITGNDFFTNYKSVIKNDSEKAVYSVLLNIRNPQTKDFINDPQDSGKWYSDTIKQIKKNNYDSAILTNVVDAGIRSHYTNEQWDEESKSWKRFVTPTVKYEDYYKGTDYVVFEPEQIHILGSKQDIEGFKAFVESNNTKTNNSELIDKNTESEIKPIVDAENKTIKNNYETFKEVQDFFDSNLSTMDNIYNAIFNNSEITPDDIIKQIIKTDNVEKECNGGASNSSWEIV